MAGNLHRAEPPTLNLPFWIEEQWMGVLLYVLLVLLLCCKAEEGFGKFKAVFFVHRIKWLMSRHGVDQRIVPNLYRAEERAKTSVTRSEAVVGRIWIWNKKDPHWSKCRYEKPKKLEEKYDIPESLLDAAHVVQLPILLGDILLANGHTRPLNTQLGDAVDVVLVQVDLESTEVTLGPLGEAPLLNDLLGGVELDELAGHVAVEDGELAAGLGVELAGCTAGEGGDALGVGEGGVQLLGGSAELVRCGHGGGVNGDLAGGGGGGGGSSGSSLLLAGRGVEGGRSEASRGVDAGSVLEVLGVLGDERFCEGGQSLAELGKDLGANEVLYGLLGGSIGVDLNLELDTVAVLVGESSFPGISLEGNARLGQRVS